MRRIFALEYLRSNSTSDLTVTIHKADGEGRASRTARGLYAPRPLQRVPRAA